MDRLVDGLPPLFLKLHGRLDGFHVDLHCFELGLHGGETFVDPAEVVAGWQVHCL